MSDRYFEKFCDRLNESPWMGAVCEVGIGIPFQSAYMNHPGASRTILFTHSPYSKAFQPAGIRRSVSLEMSAKYAWDNYRECLYNDSTQNDYLFSLAVSAAHKVTGQRGQSHGWVTVVAGKGKGVPQEYSFHWRIHKSYQRAEAGAILSDYIAWFLEMILLGTWSTWGFRRTGGLYLSRSECDFCSWAAFPG